MKDLIESIKNLTPQQRLNVFYALLIGGCLLLIKTLQNDVEIAREGRARLFELYTECVTQKSK